MNKLVGFLWGDREKERARKREAASAGNTPTRGASAPPRFTPEEKAEVYATLRRAKDSRATVVLMGKLQEDSTLQKEFTDLQEALRQSESSEGDVTEEEEEQFSTMRVYALSSEKRTEECSEPMDSSVDDEEGGDFSTMRFTAGPTSSGGGDSEDVEEGAMDFSTTRFIPDDEAAGGTCNFVPQKTSTPKRSGSAISEDKRQGLKNRPGKKKKESKASIREKKKRKRDKKKGNDAEEAANEAPSFLQAFREPEEWELNILALEKGEAREGMMDNSAFKRWNKKDRPSVPSMLLKMDSADPIQEDSRSISASK